MGVLMRNGRSYGTGSQIASGVRYDNSVSDLSATNVQNAIDEIAGGIGTWSIVVACLTGDTSVTITDDRITTSSAVELFKNTGTASVIVKSKTITEGQVVYTFDALTEATSFRVRITNNFNMPGGGATYFSDLGDVGFESLSDGQLPVYNGQTHKWENKNVFNEVYSTTETMVGTWIDGKPIYRKVCPISIPSSWGSVTITNPPSNMKWLLDATYSVLNSGNLVRNSYSRSTSEQIQAVFQIAGGSISSYGVCTFGTSSGYVILEYTKTTD